MSAIFELNKNNAINPILVSAFADHGCIRFYLDKNSKITSNFPKRSPWTTQRVEIKEKMDNSEFPTSMGNNRKDQNKIQDLNEQMQFKDMHCFIQLW